MHASTLRYVYACGHGILFPVHANTLQYVYAYGHGISFPVHTSTLQYVYAYGYGISSPVHVNTLRWLARTFTYTVYGRIFGDFSAKNTVYTPYVYGFGQAW